MNQTAKTLEHRHAQGSNALSEVVTLLFNLYDIMCPALLEHSRELARSCEDLALALGWDEKEARMAFLGGLLHDVGHLLAPGDILNWRGDEAAPAADMAAEHPALGVKFLKGVKCLEPILPAVHYHHEHYDGTGFPEGLKGDDIPALARLVAVCHSYQTYIRGYAPSEPMSEADARQVIREDAGIVLDPAMAGMFLKILPPLETGGDDPPEPPPGD